MKSGKSYYESVWQICEQIPRGRVCNYGAIADALALGSARMVGYALNKRNLCERYVPAHRVVNHKGELTGRRAFHPPELMQELLEKEGIKVEKHRVVDFEKVFWSPLELIEE